MTFQPRIKAIKAASKDEETERPRKRRKSQTTMTQLDFGNRSFLDAVYDSDEGSALDSDPESTPKPTSKKSSRRRKLPAKTESQDTLTQFVKRASDVSMMIISNSEDEGLLSDVELGDPAGDETGPPMAKFADVLPKEEGDIVEQQDGLPQVEEQLGRSSPVQVSLAPMHRQPPPSQAANDPPKTPPRRIRVLPVPSSRSPPDTHLSTQVSSQPRNEPQSHRSPLQERSVNIQRPSRDAPQKSPIKASSKKRATPAMTTMTQIRGDSPTKLRVREFNARFAILEEENAELRRSRGPVARPAAVHYIPKIPSQTEPQSVRIADVETQYPVFGDETQKELMRIKLADAITEVVEHAAQASGAKIIKSSQSSDADSTEKLTVPHYDDFRLQQQQAPNDVEDQTAEAILVDDILIPSSQSQISRQVVKIAPSSQPEVAFQSNTFDDMANNDESLPESTYNSVSAESTASKLDTQDLASDQLMRETQHAFLNRVPSSPLAPVPPSSFTACAKASQQARPSLPRPSQATTVDRTMTHSTTHTQHLAAFKTQPEWKAPENVMSSSPIEEPLEIEDDIKVQVISSPLIHPPGLTDVWSSPKLTEPQTPSLLRNMKAPLTLSDLMSESLGQSLPMPPIWRYDDDEEDDDEL
jgi:hypothetical protein